MFNVQKYHLTSTILNMQVCSVTCEQYTACLTELIINPRRRNMAADLIV